MKRFTYLLLTLLLLAVAGRAQVKKGRATREAEVEKQLSERKFQVNARYAYPMGGQTVMLNYPYSLRLSGDSVFAYLPYYGRAYSLPYGGGEGLNFAGKATGYKQTQKKGRYDISFSVQTEEDCYAFQLSVFRTGDASLSVSMNRKQSISFAGGLDF